MAASIGCSLFLGGFLSKNHYPRVIGAFFPFRKASHTFSFGGLGFTLIVRILTGWIPLIGFIATLVLLLPSLAVTVRRLADLKTTEWWLLLPIVLRWSDW